MTMSSDVDVAFSVSVPLSVGLFVGAVLIRGLSDDSDHTGNRMPRTLREAASLWLAPVVTALISLGVSASAVTASSLVLGLIAAAFVALGHFGIASVVFLVAALCDALDGLVARATRTASVTGALFDASADRYQEFFVLGGLAVFFRNQPMVLVDVLFAIMGSFMVSYGSAKAEAFGVPVPEGRMRRADRAIWLGAGILLTPLAQSLADSQGLPGWIGVAPVLLSVSVIALFANLSAISRIRSVARLLEPAQVSRPQRRPIGEPETWAGDRMGAPRDDRGTHEAPITRHAL